MKTRSLLLVEDEAIIALVHKQMLEHAGFTVEIASSGEAAVSTVTGDRTLDLILMDIDLGPGIDGTEAARLILQELSIPILFLSSHTEREIVEKTEAITSYGYVVKNSSPTVLLASIGMAFKLQAAEQNTRWERDALRSLMIASPVGIMVVDRHLHVVEINPAAEKMTGRTISAMERPRCGDFLGCVSRRDAPCVCGETTRCSDCTLYQDIEHALRDRKTAKHREQRFDLSRDDVSQQDRSTWLRYSATPVAVRGESAVLVMFEDVTENHDQQERNQLLSRIAESDNTLVIITDAQRRTTWVNDSCLHLTGFSREELLDKNPGELLQGPSPDPDLKSRMSRAFDAGKPFQGETLNYTKSGEPYWIYMNIQPVRNEVGKLTHFVAVEQDVTDRRRFDEQLLARELRINTVMQRSSDGIVVMDAHGTVTEVNPAYALLTGRSREDIVGRTPEEIFQWFHPDDAAYLAEKLYGALAARVEAMIYRFRLRTPSGTYIWLEDHAFCFYDSQGTVEQSYVFTRDITDLKAEEASFRVQ